MESVLHCVRLPLIDFRFFLFSGALRLPDGPKKPVALKPVERKPLESVVRYLGRKTVPRQRSNVRFLDLSGSSVGCVFMPVTWFDGRVNTKCKQLFYGMV